MDPGCTGFSGAGAKTIGITNTAGVKPSRLCRNKWSDQFHGSPDAQSFTHSKRGESLKSVPLAGLWHLLREMYMCKGIAQDLLCLAYEQKGKTDMYTWHELQQKCALQHSSFTVPPVSCDLLVTAGPTRQGDDTRTLTTLTYLAKPGPTDLTVRGLSRHLVPKKTQLRMNSLRDPTRQGGVVPTVFCAGCGRRRSRGTAGTMETQQT